MGHRDMIWSRHQPAQLLAWGIRFFLAAALTATQTPGDYAPFALGCVAACGPGAGGIAALLGAGVGAVLFLDFSGALPFLAAAILIFTTAAAFQGLKLLEGPLFHPLAGAGLFLAVSGIYVLQSLSPLRNLAPCLAATALVGISAWYYQPLLQAGGERPEPDSLLFLAGSILLALVDVELAGVSVGRSLLCLLLAYTAYQRGAMTGVAAGLGAGLAADFCSGRGGVLFGAAYGLAGLLAGSRSSGRRIWAALAFWGAAALAALPAGLSTPLLPEAAVGAVLFLMLPGRAFGGKRVMRGETPEFPAALEGMRAQLTRMAAALRALYDSMGRAAPVSTEENPAVVFDRAAEKVCRGCALCELCWQKEYTGTFNALNDATPFLLERGRALAKDFPSYFADRCIHLPDFLTAVNGELSAFLLRRQYRRQLEETRRSGAMPPELQSVQKALSIPDMSRVQIGSVLFANKPGDGSAREQAASCQRVLGGCANLCYEFATKRYRSNCVNWGMLPFTLAEGTDFPGHPGDFLYVPQVREKVTRGDEEFPALLLTDSGIHALTLYLKNTTAEERELLLTGCLMNHYAAQNAAENRR